MNFYLDKILKISARAFPAILIIFINIIFAGNNEAKDVAFLTSFLNIAVILNFIFRFGCDQFLIRELTKNFDEGIRLFISIVKLFTIIIIILSVVINICYVFINDSIPIIYVNCFIFTIFTLVFSSLSSFILQVKGYYYRSVLFYNLAFPLILAFLTGSVAFFKGGLNEYIMMFPLSGLVIFIYVMFGVNQFITFDSSYFSLRFDLIKTCHVISPFLIVVIMDQVIQWTTQLYGMFIIEEREFIALINAQRVSYLFAFFLTAINMIISPSLNRLYQSSDFDRCKCLLRTAAFYSFILILPAFIVVIFFSKEIFSMFFPDYQEYHYFLVILSFGQLFNVVTGSVGMFLVTLGEERTLKRITVKLGLLSLLLGFILGYSLGGLGLIINTVLVLILLNSYYLINVKRVSGFYIFPKYYNSKMVKKCLS